jgi:hypothetical protein
MLLLLFVELLRKWHNVIYSSSDIDNCSNDSRTSFHSLPANNTTQQHNISMPPELKSRGTSSVEHQNIITRGTDKSLAL